MKKNNFINISFKIGKEEGKKEKLFGPDSPLIKLIIITSG